MQRTAVKINFINFFFPISSLDANEFQSINMKLSLHTPCTRFSSSFFCTTFSLTLEWDMRYVNDWRDGFGVHVLGRSNIAITPNTQADLQNARLGRDVEMCSEARRRHWLKRGTEKYSLFKAGFRACSRHQLCVPIPFFAETSRKFHACVKKQGRQEKRDAAREKSRTKRLAKIGQLCWWCFLDINTIRTHLKSFAFDSGDDDDDTVPLQ